MSAKPPDDIDAICIELDIGLKRRARLADEKGEDGLLPYLQKLWRATRERPRLLHRNPGAGRADYTDNLARAMRGEPGGEPEAVPEELQTLITMQAHGKWAEFEAAERPEEVAEQQAKQLTRKLRRLQADAAKLGIDITPRLVAMIREAEREIAEHRAA